MRKVQQFLKVITQKRRPTFSKMTNYYFTSVSRHCGSPETNIITCALGGNIFIIIVSPLAYVLLNL